MTRMDEPHKTCSENRLEIFILMGDPAGHGRLVRKSLKNSGGSHGSTNHFSDRQ
jgi:hypothetical protein